MVRMRGEGTDLMSSSEEDTGIVYPCHLGLSQTVSSFVFFWKQDEEEGFSALEL